MAYIKYLTWHSILSSILITCHIVTISEVDVDIVPGMPCLTTTHDTLPLGCGQLWVSILGNVVLVTQFVTHHYVALDIPSVSVDHLTESALKLTSVPGILNVDIRGRSLLRSLIKRKINYKE